MLDAKNKKRFMKLLCLCAVLVLFGIGWNIFQSKCQISIQAEDIDYILLYGWNVEIDGEVLAEGGELDKRLEDEASKKELVNYLNVFGRLKVYHQGDPILGTPDFFIRAFFHRCRFDFHGFRNFGFPFRHTLYLLFQIINLVSFSYILQAILLPNAAIVPPKR